MLVSEAELRYDMLYMGPGNGCRHVLTCDAIDFTTEIDSDNQHQATRAAVAQIDSLIFSAFCNGNYRFPNPSHQTAAVRCRSLTDEQLVDLMYDNDSFVATFAMHEMQGRGIWDQDIYRIGEHGPAVAQSQAITLLKQAVKDKLTFRPEPNADG